jgi:aryl-alcohol dehydrogenase-like predicted oxidoreductase
MFKGDGLESALRLVEELRPVAQRHDTSVGTIAIAWTLAFPGVTGAIVGARTPAQIDGWIDAATVELDKTDLDDVAAAVDRSGLGTGPSRS